MNCGGRCSKCLTACHEGCMSSDSAFGELCISCADAYDQRHEHEAKANSISKSGMAMADAALANESKCLCLPPRGRTYVMITYVSKENNPRTDDKIRYI